MSSPYAPVLDDLTRQRGVRASLIVSESDGLVVESRLRFGERSNRPTRRAFRGTSRATPRLSGCRSSCEKPAGMEGGVSLRQCIAGLAKQSKAEKECSHA